MPRWLIAIYVLVTSRVPHPRVAIIFAMAVLVSYAGFTLMPIVPNTIGVGAEVLTLLTGHIAIVWRNLPIALRNYPAEFRHRTLRWMIFFPICTSAAAMLGPSLPVVQHGLSVIIVFYLAVFLAIASFKGELASVPWFARDWDPANQSNAVRWNVVRLVGLITANEALIRTATPNEWLVAVALGPIVFHYLMHWTLVAMAVDPTNQDP